MLDRDGGAVRERQVEGAGRCGDVERDAVRPGEKGNAVCPDLIRRVSVAHDAVGADNDGRDPVLASAGAEQRRGHGVGDERARDALVHELEGGEAAALVIRSGLACLYMGQVSVFVKGSDHTQSGTIACRG